MYNYNLIHIFETVTNGYAINVLDLITLTSIIITVLVIISKNPVVSVLFLIGLFLNIACYLILLGLNFVGLSYLLVYVGAVSILFLFILMLINVRVSELVTESTNSIPLMLIIAMFFSFPAQQILPVNTPNVFIGNALTKITSSLPTSYLSNNLNEYINNHTNNTLYVTSKLWDGNLAETTHITSIGNVMYSNYSLWLIMTSIILLLAMVGTIVITIKKNG